ncbi:UvrD-helicase domain-containing protein [bacterium]|nr:UvrD-helicase domain-containing protein [bacterium]
MSERLKLTDQDARQRIVNDTGHCILVEAAAGTGKTTSLVMRMTALLRQGLVRIEHLAAMTFTVKAAGHLRQKFEVSLQSALSEPDLPPNERQRIVDALHDIDRPFIGTIHAFCAQLLRERPLEAGVDPDFHIIDDQEAAALQQRIFFLAMRKDRSGSTAAKEMLRSLQLPLSALQETYALLCEHPDTEFPAERRAEPDLRPARDRLIELYEILAPAIPPDVRPKEDALQGILRSLRLVELSSLTSAGDIARVLAPFMKDSLLTQKRWDEIGLDGKHTVAPLLEDFLQNYAVSAYSAWKQYCYPLLIEHARPLAALFREELQSRGALTHDDLLLRTRDMLREHPSVREDLQQRYTHLLVDEFQDTDPAQAEIMLYLTGEDVSENAWRKLCPRAGSLFVVGDPRQSIYRFRQADISIYNVVANIIERGGEQRLRLDNSFRSLPAITDWVNTRFSEIFPEEATPYQAAAAPLTPVRANLGGFTGVYAFPLQCSDRRKPEQCLLEETEALASWTADALRSGMKIQVRTGDGEEELRALRPEDILLLTPENAGITAFADAMERAGIPVTIAGGFALRDRVTLRPIMQILHALADPLDEISVVAFLRGPYCGVDDAALTAYRDQGGRFTFFSSVVKDADARILDGLAFIKGKVRLLRSLPPAAVVGSVLEELGLLAWTSTDAGGNMRAGTLQRLMEFVQHYSARGFSLAEIVGNLDAATRQSPVDGMPLFPDTHALRIMNVHKAKGLEAPIVILAQHRSRQRKDRERLCVDRSTAPPTGSMRIHAKQGEYNGPQVAVSELWDRQYEEEQRFLEAERMRLQYVAATRAENALIIAHNANMQNVHKETWSTLLQTDLPAAPSFGPVGQQDRIGPPADPAVPFDASAREKIETRLHDAAAEGYELLSPSRLTLHAATPVSASSEHGHGARFGTAAHRLFELALQQQALHDEKEIDGDSAEKRLQDICARIASDEGLDAAMEVQLRDLSTRVSAHPLWQRMQNARRWYTELPFGTAWEEDADAMPAVMSGVMDAVFEDETGWTIVDYKTDLVETMEDPRVAAYRSQISAYATAWERMTGTRPATILWFVMNGLLVE